MRRVNDGVFGPRQRKRNDLLAAVVLSGDVSLVHLLQCPAIKVAKAFIPDFDDGGASRYGLAHGPKPQGRALAALVEMPPTTEGKAKYGRYTQAISGPSG
jgi:hypothetical protein